VPSRFTTVAVASALGLSVLSATVVAIPALAASVNGDSPSAAVSKRVSAIRDSLQGLVDDKTLTDAQADKVAETLGEKGEKGGPFEHGPGLRGGHLLGFAGEGLKPAADVLGMRVEDVQAALRQGTTLAELAKQKNKSVDDVVAALTKPATERIDQAVADGRIDKTRADALKQKVSEGVRTFVEEGFKGSFGKFGMGGPGFPGHGDRRDGRGPEAPSPAPSPSASTSSFGA
jgi:hypothetical protein